MGKIDINHGSKILEFSGKQLLIDVLKAQGIHLPSACGSTGKCGLCKVKVLSGAGSFSSQELIRLTEEERASGTRLSCQIDVEDDVEIEIPKEYLSSQEFVSKVVGKRFLTSDIIELKLELVTPSSISFLPGQYILFKVPARGEIKAVMRPFSIASSTTQNSCIELNIRLNPQGTCTPYIFNELQVEQEVKFSGPRGNFYIRNTEYPMLFIAGGSGMAPARSILNTMADNHIDRDATYFFGALTQRDLFYVDEMKSMENNLHHFRFIPALSNEPVQSDWAGERGLITETLDHLLVGDYSEYEAYLCGKPAMIEACVSVLEGKKIPRERMYFDPFNVARPAR